MKITLHSTHRLVGYSDPNAIPGMPIMVREWEGVTDDGVPVLVYVASVQPQTHDPEVNARFARELMGKHGVQIINPEEDKPQ